MKIERKKGNHSWTQIRSMSPALCSMSNCLWTRTCTVHIFRHMLSLSSNTMWKNGQSLEILKQKSSVKPVCILEGYGFGLCECEWLATMPCFSENCYDCQWRTKSSYDLGFLFCIQFLEWKAWINMISKFTVLEKYCYVYLLYIF